MSVYHRLRGILQQWPAVSGKMENLTLDLKPLKIMLQKLDILITPRSDTSMSNFMGIGSGVPAPQIAEI